MNETSTAFASACFILVAVDRVFILYIVSIAYRKVAEQKNKRKRLGVEYF
jgi:hypothetical protein